MRKTSLLLPASVGWTLLLYAALVLATGWAYAALRVRTDREQTFQSEANRLRAVAVALEAGALAMLNDGVGAALTRATELDSAGGLARAADDTLEATLVKPPAAGPYVRSLFVGNGARFARAAATGHYEAGRTLPAWFTAPSTAGASDLWVGNPIPNPDQPAEMVVPVAHHVPSQRDATLWAGALFDFGSFASLRTQLGGPDGIIGLLTTGGTLLALMDDPRGPHPKLGANYASSPLFKQAPLSAQSGVVQGFAPALGTHMVFAYGRVPGYPVTVLTGRQLDAMLGAWADRTRTTLIVTAAFSALVLVMTLLLFHSLQALRRRELHYRTLFNNAAFGVFLAEGYRFVAANQTAVHMFGLGNSQAVRGMTPWMLSPPEQPDGRPSEAAAREHIERALREGNTTFEWLHRRLDTGETFPARIYLSSLDVGRTVLRLSVIHDLSHTRRAEQLRYESEGRYRALVDALPEAVFVHRGGELLFVNEAGCRLVGAAPGESLAGRPVFSFALDDDRGTLAERTRQILEHGVSAEPRETRVRRLDGSLISVEVQGVRVEYGGLPAVQSVMRDITAVKAREQAEAARSDRVQRQSAALVRLASRDAAGWRGLATALQSIGASTAQVLAARRVSIWLLENEGTTLRCAALCERGQAQVSEVELPADGVARLLAALRRERVIEAARSTDDPRLLEFVAAASSTGPAGATLAAAVRTAGELAGVVGIELPAGARSWQPDEVSFAGGVADQVAQAVLDSQRERVLAELRVLAGELMRVQDEERRRIGRDLHDSTGQSLVALELDLARLSECARALGGAERELLGNAVQLARQCSAEIRTASYLLHPPLLDELGLASALRWVADGLRERGGIEVRLELSESVPRLPLEAELSLFRVAQEALTNVQRHSTSPWVALRLAASADCVALEIEDAGRGVAAGDVARAAGGAAPSGVGLAGMRERMRQVGGSFEVESAYTGTRVRATVPLPPVPEVRRA